MGFIEFPRPLQIRREGTRMVNFYVRKIQNSDGEFTIEDVPTLWRKKVEKALAELATSQE